MSNLLEQASLVMIPSGYKEDVVYSEIPIDGSGDLSFTRASNGTRINSQGLVEVCPWNLVTYSEQFDNAGWVKDLGASVTANTTTAPNGTTTADTLTIASGQYMYQNLSLIVGQSYTISVYVRVASGTKQFKFNTYGSGNEFTSSAYTATTEWQRFEYTFTAVGSGTTGIYPVLVDGLTGGAFYIWGAQLNIGTTAKPYFPTTDRLNVPRLTYQNGGGGCPSLLLEKQSTNLYPYSEDLTQWLTIGTPTITGNNATSPDGTTNADRVQFSGSGDLVYNSGTGSAGTNTLTVYAKAKTGTAQKFRFFANGATTISSDFSATDQWQRFEFSYTYSAQTAGLQGASTGASDVLFWGFQHEVSSYATSYIGPTTSSSATRVADACFKTGISSLIGQTQGVLFVDLVITGTTGNNRFSISDGSNTNWIFIGTPEDGATRSSRFYIKTNGVVHVDTGTSSYFTIGQRYKLALAYKSGDWAVYANGSLLYSGTDSIAAVSSPLSVFNFFNATGGNADTGEQVNQAVIFPTRLTNAELASLTTI